MSVLIKVIIYILFTIFNIIISRKMLNYPKSHGFFRFFAWEFMAALLCINMDQWFVNPWSWHQLVSWFLLVISIIPLIFGIRDLKMRGKTGAQREEEPGLLAFEKTSALITTGIFHYIRHPLYCSLLFLNWGIFFKGLSWPGLILALISTALLIATAKADESECMLFFGPDYQEYMKKTKMFIPFVI